MREKLCLAVFQDDDKGFNLKTLVETRPSFHKALKRILNSDGFDFTLGVWPFPSFKQKKTDQKLNLTAQKCKCETLFYKVISTIELVLLHKTGEPLLMNGCKKNIF